MFINKKCTGRTSIETHKPENYEVDPGTVAGVVLGQERLDLRVEFPHVHDLAIVVIISHVVAKHQVVHVGFFHLNDI